MLYNLKDKAFHPLSVLGLPLWQFGMMLGGRLGSLLSTFASLSMSQREKPSPAQTAVLETST